MKRIKIISTVALISILAFQCTEETPQAYYDLTGNVTYADGNAAGAVVYLAEGNTPTTLYTMKTIADETGSYTFENLLPGDYYLFSSYNTMNRNASGRLSGITFVSDDSHIITLTGDNTHNIALVHGTGNGAGIDTETGTWTIDRNHSEVVFEFPYRDNEMASFSGRFNTYDFVIDIDDSDLAGSSIYGEVDLTSVNTGQPGRDGGNNCIASTLGVQWTDTDGDGETGEDPEDTIVGDTGMATFESTDISFYGDGYKAVGNMRLNSTTTAVTVYFKFNPGYADDTRHYSSFEAMVEFDALQGFGVDSGNIAGDVTLWISVQVRNNL